MNSFQIRVKSTVYYETEVPAENEAGAKEIVARLIADGELTDLYQVDSTEFEIVE